MKANPFTLAPAPCNEPDAYERFYRNVLKHNTVEQAEESCKILSRLYDYFERLGDREGQHRACVVALIGKNRARWSGKYDEAAIFDSWLVAH